MFLLLWMFGCGSKAPKAPQTPVIPSRTEASPAEVVPSQEHQIPKSDPNARPLRVFFDGDLLPSQADLVCGQNRYRVRLQKGEAFFQAVSGESCLLRAKPMGTTAQIQVQDEMTCTLREGGVTMACR